MSSEQQKHPSIHDISKRLQQEVDSILAHVDEKMMFAEFRDDEIIDLKENDQTDSVRPTKTLEERITSTISKHASHKPTSQPERVKHNIKKASMLFGYFFKPLQY